MNWKYLGPKIWNIIPPDIRNCGNIKEFTRKLIVGLLKNVLITSITLGISISHIFDTSHSEMLWQIEKVPILAGDIMMAASALKIYSWLSFFMCF